MCIYKEWLSSVIWSLVIDGKVFELISKSYNTKNNYSDSAYQGSHLGCSIIFQFCTYYNIFKERNHQSKSDHPWFKKVDTQHKSDVNSCGFGFIFPCKHFSVKNETFWSCTRIWIAINDDKTVQIFIREIWKEWTYFNSTIATSGSKSLVAALIRFKFLIKMACLNFMSDLSSYLICLGLIVLILARTCNISHSIIII